MMYEPDSQPAGIQPASQPATNHQPASCQGVVKVEPVDDSDSDTDDLGGRQFETSDTKREKGGVDFKCDFSYDPGLSVDWCSSSGESQAALKCEDPEPSSEQKGTPEESDDLRTSPPTSANTSGAQQSQNRSYKCQLCSSAFVLFSFLKQHMASVHGEKVPEQDSHLPEEDEEAPEEDVLPVFFAPKRRCNAGQRRNRSSANNTKNSTTTTTTATKKKKVVVGGGGGKNKKPVKREKEDHAGSHNNNKKTDSPANHETERTAAGGAVEGGESQTVKKGRHGRHASGRFVCELCNKIFTRRDNLKRHKIIHMDFEVEQMDGADLDKDSKECDAFSKAFTQTGDLKTGRYVHPGRKIYVCDLCNKTFAHSDSLRRHKLIHTGYRQYVCDVCSKAFTQAGDLKRHKLIHTGERQFVCELCLKDFTQAGDLKRHHLIHTGHKQYVCDVCSKAFTQACHLKRHRLTHTGQKHYVCDVCGKAFTEAGTLKRHKRIHEGERRAAESAQLSTLS